VIQRAVDSLHGYIRRKTNQLRAAVADLKGMLDLNHRQRSLLTEALRHPGEAITVESHRRTHGVVTQTARTDLTDLVDRELLTMTKVGRAYTFYPVHDLAERLRRLPD
jgi:Fic family protein